MREARGRIGVRPPLLSSHEDVCDPRRCARATRSRTLYVGSIPGIAVVEKLTPPHVDTFPDFIANGATSAVRPRPVWVSHCAERVESRTGSSSV